MLFLETDIAGEQMEFGDARNLLKDHGFTLGGNWEYHYGYFDGIIHREHEQGETIYIRIPFKVIKGELDHHRALIEFEQAFVIKHVVNVGLDRDANSLLDATGFSQFQKPLDKDAHISNKNMFVEFGEEAVGDILNRLNK